MLHDRLFAIRGTDAKAVIDGRITNRYGEKPSGMPSRGFLRSGTNPVILRESLSDILDAVVEVERNLHEPADQLSSVYLPSCHGARRNQRGINNSRVLSQTKRQRDVSA